MKQVIAFFILVFFTSLAFAQIAPANSTYKNVKPFVLGIIEEIQFKGTR
jgi:hypothetical protein